MPKSRKRKKKQKPTSTSGNVPMTPVAEAVLRRQLQLFKAKFGRDPGPGDPVFFDPNADEPRPWPEGELDAQMMEAFQRAGTPPDIVYAYKKTGLLLRKDTPASPQDRKEWDDAIAEYFELERKASRNSDAS